MKVGDLVWGREHEEFPNGDLVMTDIGLIIEVIDHHEVPPVVKVLWPDGVIDKEWTDELEEVYESR